MKGALGSVFLIMLKALSGKGGGSQEEVGIGKGPQPRNGSEDARSVVRFGSSLTGGRGNGWLLESEAFHQSRELK